MMKKAPLRSNEVTYDINPQVQVALSSKQHEEPQKFLRKYSNQGCNQHRHLLQATCWEKQGFYQLAIKPLAQLSLSHPDDDIFLRLGRGHEAIKHYQDAIIAYQKIKKPTDYVRIHLAKCLERMGGDKKEILALYRSCTELLPLAINLLQASSRYMDALSILEGMQDINAIILRASCYAEMRQVGPAVAEYLKLKSYTKKDVRILLGLAACFQLNEWVDDAYHSLLLAEHCFPENNAVLYAITKHRIAYRHASAYWSLRLVMALWPEDLRVPELRKAYSQQFSSAEHYLALQRLFFRAPMRLFVYSDLIDYCIRIHNQRAAWAWFHLARSRFPKEVDFLSELLIKLKQVTCSMQINMIIPLLSFPDLCASFDQLAHISKKVFLVGGSVFRLLRHEPLHGDFDFVVVDKDAKSRLDDNQSWRRSKYNERLYMQKNNQNHLDCFLSPFTTLTVFFAKDPLSRDYSISSVYIGPKGEVHDPTGLGIYDIQHGILRTVDNPQICLQHDPARVLRGAKYMALKCTPVPELERAFRNTDWTPEAKEQHQAHLEIVLRDHVMLPLLSLAFVAQLKKYHWSDKLFNFRSNINLLQLQWILVTYCESRFNRQSLQTAEPLQKMTKRFFADKRVLFWGASQVTAITSSIAAKPPV